MSSIHFKVSKSQSGKRLDVILSTQNISRSLALKIIKESLVKIDNKIVKKASIKVLENQTIEFNLPEIKKIELNAIDLNIEILYEDEHLAVVNKPAGLSVHPSSTENNPTLVHGLLHSLKSLSSIGGVERPGIVHRIDKGTSGILLVSKNDDAHQSLAKQFKEHSITRKYKALTYGDIRKKAEAGKIKTFFGRNTTQRKKMTGKLTKGRIAITNWRWIKTFKNSNCSLIECILETGRTHQIRVHMSEFGFPIVGDPLYGKKQDSIAKQFNLSHQLLHAYYLKFVHPKTLKSLEFQTELPKDFEQIINELD